MERNTLIPNPLGKKKKKERKEQKNTKEKV